jgi:toxin ParE1/3/4
MKKHKIVFLPAARDDLFALYDYIADRSDPAIAGGFIDRNIRKGIRTLGFERRATIAFQVNDIEVVIVRIFYGGRDYETSL